jgi:hypothetical protein
MNAKLWKILDFNICFWRTRSQILQNNINAKYQAKQKVSEALLCLTVKREICDLTTVTIVM